jgi:putative DNA primase/helicase
MKAHELLSRLDGVKKQSKGWIARCPAHDDKKASLSINDGEKGVVLKCFVGCSTAAICEALSIKEANLFYEETRSVNRWESYLIKDTQGRTVAVRKRKGTGEKKELIWELPNGKRGLGGLKTVDLPLFGSENLKNYDRQRWIDLHEGEAKTWEARSLGAQALGTSTGASAIPSRQVLASLRGFKVRLWPDNDEPGRQHMKRIDQELSALGIECVLLDTRCLPKKGDVVQWIESQLQTGTPRHELPEVFAQDELPGLPKEAQPILANGHPTGTQQVPNTPQVDPFGDIPTYTIEELLALDIPERASLCGPFVENSISMLFAPPGIGKSWLAEGLALAVATGTPFLKWQTPSPRKVLLVDGELNVKDFQVRFQKMMKANGKPTNGNLRVILANQSPSGTLPDLRTEAGQAFIESRLDGVDFLILDSRSTLFRYQDENDSASWQEVQDWLQKIRKRCAILLIHHANKAGQQRGTSALEVLPELILKLDRPADYNPTQGARFTLAYTKARNLTGEEAGEFECALEPDERGDGLLWTWSNISGGKKTAIVEKLKENPELGVRALARAVGADPGYVSQVKKQYQASLGAGRGGVVVGSLEKGTQQHPPSSSPRSEATTQQVPNTDPTPRKESSLFTGDFRRERPNTDPTPTQHPVPTPKNGEATGTQHLPNGGVVPISKTHFNGMGVVGQRPRNE